MTRGARQSRIALFPWGGVLEDFISPIGLDRVGFAEEMSGGWGTALIWLAVASLIIGSLMAFRQPDPRGVVAYSSLTE